jgi:hypothetical protein
MEEVLSSTHVSPAPLQRIPISGEVTWTLNPFKKEHPAPLEAVARRQRAFVSL